MTVTGTATTAQLLPNGTFDTNANDWQGLNGATIARDTGTVHAGAGSLKVTCGAAAVPTAESGTTGRIPVTPGEIVTYTVWVRPTTSQTLTAAVNFFNGSSTFISGVGTPQAVLANTWAQITTIATAVSGAVTADVNVYIAGTPGAGVIYYIDDVVLTSNLRQTLTVTRSVNGIVKSHTTGDALDVALPDYYGM